MDMRFLFGAALLKFVVVVAMILGALPALAGAEKYMALPLAGFRQSVIAECPPDMTRYREGNEGSIRCVAKPPCSLLQIRDARGNCHCPAGMTEIRIENGFSAKCIAKPSCAAGQTRDVQGNCNCPSGTTSVRSGNVRPAKCIANH